MKLERIENVTVFAENLGSIVLGELISNSFWDFSEKILTRN